MISVIIPTFNEETTIEQTLQQFSPELLQKFEIELIVSDGGSKDRTVELAREKAHLILIHDKPRKQTIGEGRNEGARHSKGEILVFLDSDIRVENAEQFFSVIQRTLREPAVVAATCPVFVYPQEATISDRIYHEIHNLHIRLLLAIGIGTGRGECHIVSRKEFFLVGGYNETLAAGEDFDLYWRLARRGRIKFLNSLRVYESPRRYRKLGYLRITFTWFLNALNILLRRRSFSREWKPVR